MRNRALLLALVLVASLPLSAQLVLDTVTVEVVDVPVFVSRGDRPVEGLTADQFELYVNGVRQPIEYFEAANAHDRASTLRERRLFLLLFDVAFMHPLSLPRTQRAALQLIAGAPAADYFAVATYSNRRGVWFAAPFTRDREVLARAIRSLNDSRSGDPLAIVLTAAERAAVANVPFDPESMLRDIARMERQRAAEDQVDALAALSGRLGALEGQKHVVVLSEGWDGRPQHTMPLASMRGPGPTLRTRLDAMHRRFHAAGVFLHTLDVEGVSARFTGNDSLYVLAHGTGGQFVRGRNDLALALADLSASLDRGYRLGFRPVNAKRGDNTIEVRVRNAGRVRVEHRRGFSTTGGAPNTSDGLYLADVLLNDVPQSGTAPRLSLREGTLTAEIPMRELAAQGRAAELLVYAFAKDGSALMYHREVLRVAGDEVAFVIAVPAGTHAAKALLRVNGSVGFAKVTR